MEDAPTSEAEPVASEIELGKTPDELKPQFMRLYELLSGFGDVIDHGSSSKRFHFKCGRKGYGLLFYGMKPKLQLCHVKERIKKKQFTTYPITVKGPVNDDGSLLTVKKIQKIIRKFKKDRGL